MKKQSLLFLSLVLLTFAVPGLSEIPPSELPMYGNRPRSADQKKIDDEFIGKLVKMAGTKQEAFKSVMKLGFQSLQQRDLKTAMQRFNIGWLLMPEGADVYWAFGSALIGQEKLDQAIPMFSKAIAINPSHASALFDLAHAYQQKAQEAKAGEENYVRYLDQSDELFERAVRLSPQEEQYYSLWAKTLYLRGRYGDAWKKIGEARKLGGKTIKADFLTELSKAMPDPSQ